MESLDNIEGLFVWCLLIFLDLINQFSIHGPCDITGLENADIKDMEKDGRITSMHQTLFPSLNTVFLN